MKLSIITINKNNARGLERTIQSVIQQTSTDYEYIVIDGASRDGSVDSIKKYADKINYWVSEPDAGIYNAMNKGIRKASGDYCLFLNSGDTLLASKTLETVFSEISGRHDFYYCNLRKDNGTYVFIPEKVGINYLISGTFNHQNMFIRRSLFFKHGFYNENFKILSDTEFYLKEAWFYKATFFHLKTDISLYDSCGLSTRYPEQLIDNERKIMFNNVFNELGETIYDLYKFRMGLYGNIISNYGYSKSLHLLLRLYRFFANRIIGLLKND
jgi:glycosyltransferase involved in cell wall biosynthesis